MFSGLHHFNLIVADKEKTKAFYHGLLGLEIALETEIEDDEFSRGVGLPGTKVLATFFKLPANNGLIETFQYVGLPAGPFRTAPKPTTAVGSTFAFRWKTSRRQCGS